MTSVVWKEVPATGTAGPAPADHQDIFSHEDWMPTKLDSLPIVARIQQGARLKIFHGGGASKTSTNLDAYNQKDLLTGRARAHAKYKNRLQDKGGQ